MVVKIYTGDALSVLRTLESESVQLVVTSPPYAFLRSYLPADHPDKAKEIGSESTPEAFVAALIEVFREVKRVLRHDGICVVNLGDSYSGSGKGRTGHNGIGDQEQRQGFSTSRNHGEGTGRGPAAKSFRSERYTRRTDLGGVSGLPPKNLLMIPFRVSMALQQDGWILRSVMPWVKRNSMPESVVDRPASAIEYLFLFARSPRYFWDSESIRQPARDWGDRDRSTWKVGIGRNADALTQGGQRGGTRGDFSETGRSYRNSDPFMATWQGLMLDEAGDPLALVVNPQPSPLQHYASYPPALVEPFVKAGTSQRGCCPACRAPWVRETTLTPEYKAFKASQNRWQDGNDEARLGFQVKRQTKQAHPATVPPMHTTTGWRPGCACYDDRYRALPKARRSRKQLQHDATGSWWKRARKRPGDPSWPANPCVVLDPFLGSGTTALVASRLGRDAVGIELSPAYAEMARQRIYGDAPLFADIEVAG